MHGEVLAVYRRLREAWGHAGWWPARTRFEVCVGAILTQNTAWSNAARALAQLRRAGRLSFRGLRGLPPGRIAPWIRSSGTYRVKARRLAAFVAFLDRELHGRVAAMRGRDPVVLRRKLLSVGGIGPETADCILLYGARVPTFVVDAYTRRVFFRLGLLDGGEDYEALRRYFLERLPADVDLLGDCHAQIVRLAKEACRTRPLCQACPIEDACAKRGVDGSSPRAVPRRVRRVAGNEVIR